MQNQIYIKIKQFYKHIISFVLVTTVLLPFAIQTVHAFEKHEYSDSSSLVTIDNYELETECSFFHYKINNTYFDFSADLALTEINFIIEKIHSNSVQTDSVKLHFKSSRAPPFLLY